MTLNRANPENPQLSDWGATVDALTKLNQMGFVNGVTAHAGGGQQNAYQISISAPFVEVDTVGNAGDSLQLPAAIPAQEIVVINATATSLNVFPLYGNGDSINGASGTTALAVAANTMTVFRCAKLGYWGAK